LKDVRTLAEKRKLSSALLAADIVDALETTVRLERALEVFEAEIRRLKFLLEAETTACFEALSICRQADAHILFRIAKSDRLLAAFAFAAVPPPRPRKQPQRADWPMGMLLLASWRGGRR
jgi:hypothetical protein